MRDKNQSFISLYTISIEKASLACGIVAALMMAVAVFVICQAVFLRYVTGGSSIWQTEFVTYTLIASTFLGSPYVLLTKGHVRVGLLSERLQGRRKRVLHAVADFITFVVLAVVAFTAIELFLDSWSNGWKSESLWGVRMWIPHGGMALGLALLALQSLGVLLTSLTESESESREPTEPVAEGAAE